MVNRCMKSAVCVESEVRLLTVVFVGIVDDGLLYLFCGCEIEKWWEIVEFVVDMQIVGRRIKTFLVFIRFERFGMDVKRIKNSKRNNNMRNHITNTKSIF